MTTNWVEEGTLADLKHRLDKLRVHQSKQTAEDEPRKKDTLKILQSKFGSPVYDPTSPLQKAYERSCARSGRRKSIEFEDLYLKKGSGLLQLPPSFAGGPKSRSGSATARKHPLFRSSSGTDYSGQLAQLSEAGGGPSSPTSRSRKSSDPSSHFSRRGADHNSQGKARPKAAAAAAAAATTSEPTGGKKSGQGHGEGQKGQGQRGILSMRLSEEERRAIDRKLEGEADVGMENRMASDPVVGSTSQSRRKVSKTGSRP